MFFANLLDGWGNEGIVPGGHTREEMMFDLEVKARGKGKGEKWKENH